MVLTYTYQYCQAVSSIPRKQCSNNGETTGKMSMPAKFAGADGGTSFSLGRSTYINAYLNGDDKFNYAIESNLPKQGKPVQSQSADQHIQQKKNNAIGRSSTNKKPRH